MTDYVIAMASSSGPSSLVDYIRDHAPIFTPLQTSWGHKLMVALWCYHMEVNVVGFS